MTRINSGINPKQLSQKHLIAEHREIIRIPNTISSGKAVVKDIPDDFRLGGGHVKFFYDKLLYLFNRYRAIYEEGISRGYNLTNFSECWDGVPKELMNDWKPTQKACSLIRERIYERGGYFVNEKPFLV
jgi:hypothetical protein